MKEFIACSKKEWDIAHKRGNEEYKKQLIKETNDAIDKISDKIKRGTESIYHFRIEAWAKAVVESALGVDRGSITDCAIDIIDSIDYNLPVDQILEYFRAYEEKNPEEYANSVRNLVLEFSKNGYPFYEDTHKSGVWTLDECEKILRIMEVNEAYGENPEMVAVVSESKQKVYSRFKRIQKLEEKSIK